MLPEPAMGRSNRLLASLYIDLAVTSGSEYPKSADSGRKRPDYRIAYRCPSVLPT